jgi:hypothetical protein
LARLGRNHGSPLGCHCERPRPPAKLPQIRHRWQHVQLCAQIALTPRRASCARRSGHTRSASAANRNRRRSTVLLASQRQPIAWHDGWAYTPASSSERWAICPPSGRHPERRLKRPLRVNDRVFVDDALEKVACPRRHAETVGAGPLLDLFLRELRPVDHQ